VAGCQHTTQRQAEVGARMSVVLDKLGLTLQVPETVLTTRDLLVRPRQMPGMIRWWRCG
jgi:hypothetical protein